jgi:hypothetical protein
MSLYAWTQDVPIDTDAYAQILANMDYVKLPGCLVHVALEKPDGTLRYIDIWESEAACDAAFEKYIHPAVHPVLMDRGIHVQGEPPRTELKVVDWSTATSSMRDAALQGRDAALQGRDAALLP